MKSKILEKAVLRVSDFHLLDPNQSGFKSEHSTDTALLSVTEVVIVAELPLSQQFFYY